MKSLELDVFHAYGADWALVSAGSLEDYNTMTVSWGGLGTLWGKIVATVYIRPNRHTYGYLENNEFFTVSFYPEEYRADLKTLGTLSGKDCDKVAQTGLTAVAAGESVTFAQAKRTLLCRKLFAQDLDPNAIPQQVMDTFYAKEPVHRMYIGEVVEILE